MIKQEARQYYNGPSNTVTLDDKRENTPTDGEKNATSKKKKRYTVDNNTFRKVERLEGADGK